MNDKPVPWPPDSVTVKRGNVEVVLVPESSVKRVVRPSIESSALPSESKHAKTISEWLDEAQAAADISHEEQAHRINISRTTYFEVKAGRGGRKSRRKVEGYLTRVLPGRFTANPDRKPDRNPDRKPD